jgi:heme-degrading monooxygenase HmoA
VAAALAVPAIVQPTWCRRLLGQADVMDDAASPSVITVFRSRLRPDATANGYAELAARMESRARAMAGFIDFKTFTAPDGERVSIIVFDTWDHHRAWRDDPEHRAAQRRGRHNFYAEYSIYVCEQRHQHDFRLP